MSLTRPKPQTVRTIFKLYLELRSFGKLVAELDRRRIVTKRRDTKVAKYQGGIPFTYGPLAYFLKNRIYLGETHHGGKWFKGEHAAILDRQTFDRVQQLLKENNVRRGTKFSESGACSRASYLTTRATGWGRRFPARMACDTGSTSAPRCADENTTLARSPGSRRRRSKVSSRRKFGRNSTLMRSTIEELFERIERVTVSAGKIQITLGDASSNKRPIEIPWDAKAER